MKDSPFKTSLAAKPTYQLGEAIELTLTIENHTSESYQLLRWGTPLEPIFSSDYLHIERDGRRIDYDGRLVKRAEPTADSYVTLAAGGSISATVDISAAYPIDQTGHYRVSLDATLHDLFAIPGPAKVAPRKRASHEAHRLDGTTVEFDVVAGGGPKLTLGQQARQASQAKASAKTLAKAKAPQFNGGTATERADTVIAHNNAQYFAALSAAQLAAGPASSNSLYQDWFGAFDQGRYDKVTKDYQDISSNLLSNEVTYDLTGTGCQPDYFAYTHKGDDTVWLCGQYKSAPQIGTDCKFGTLIHEWSHAVSNTDDNVYGESGCQSLATSDPKKATENADSHEYFGEHLAQSDFGKSLTFVTDRSTFGKDEIDAMLLNGSPAVIQQAFYVHADGFWPDKLGITAASLGGSPNVKPTFNVSPAVPGMTLKVSSLAAEDTSLPIGPQRFTWVCEISFANDSGFPTAAGGAQTITLTATLAGLTAVAQIVLIREPNPYEIDGATSWLSTDVRVFQIRQGDGRFGATMGTNGPAFIQDVIARLNSGNTNGQSFDAVSTDEQDSALELSEKVNGTRVFNFAVARVRYRGTTDISNVRVFFRLFPASSTSTDFHSGTSYRRATSGASAIPLLGLSGSGDLLTIPCFAADRVNSATASLTTQTDAANVRTIPHGTNGAEVAAFFGCWLDINQTAAQFPLEPSPANGPWTSGRKSIQQLVRSAHQCLVAEIAFDPDPVPAGISPSASDKLAQRNLSIVESANPGLDASRRILTPFELRRAPPLDVPNPGPDELLIDWGNTPTGAVGSLYIPEITTQQVLTLASARYPRHGLTALDTQTLQIPVGGISYIPLPPGTVFGLTALLQIDLPDTVRKGEVYKVLVRQVTDAAGLSRGAAGAELGMAAFVNRRLLRWRRIVGSYQITIPVRTKNVMVSRDSRLLSVLRWIRESIPTDNRWYPVFSRYVDLQGDRVGALGGKPDAIQPSPDGSGSDGPPVHEPEPSPLPGDSKHHRYPGKISGVIYDCFGDFKGFELADCGDERVFLAREGAIECLVREAWRERMAVVVVENPAHPRHALEIILKRAPTPCAP